MSIKDLRNKKIAILGLGVENFYLVKYLIKKKLESEITVCDARKSVKTDYNLSLVKWNLGKNYKKNLYKYDIIFRSPGYPLLEKNLIKARKAGVEISSPMKLFFEVCPTKNIIGVTGTKGKGTTASLIYRILRAGGKKVWLGGNIGVAPFEFINKIKKNNWVVLELSSFQLEDMTRSPKIAVVTNFYSEHLAPADPNNPNYHKTLKDYWQSKMNILKWQERGDKAILAQKLKTKIKKLRFGGRAVYFKGSDLPTKLPGEHNKENIAAAVEVAKIIGIKDNIIKKTVAGFGGLEHRLELVEIIKGVKYYNDSFATTPESTIIALKSFVQPIILFLGGAEKKSNFKKLARQVKNKAKFIVLLNGKATPRIKGELIRAGYPANKMKLAYNIKGAVGFAKKKAEKGDIVLLSPACASFGMFKNYKERGKLFKEEARKLK